MMATPFPSPVPVACPSDAKCAPTASPCAEGYLRSLGQMRPEKSSLSPGSLPLRHHLVEERGVTVSRLSHTGFVSSLWI